MITLIEVDEGPVDIYELRMQYLAKLKETDGVMLPTFIYRNKELFVTEFKPTCDDQWIMYMTNAEGLITKMRIKNGDLMSNGSVLFLAEERKTYNAKEYYDYWTAREGKPAPFFYESRQYHCLFYTSYAAADLTRHRTLATPNAVHQTHAHYRLRFHHPKHISTTPHPP